MFKLEKRNNKRKDIYRTKLIDAMGRIATLKWNWRIHCKVVYIVMTNRLEGLLQNYY